MSPQEFIDTIKPIANMYGFSITSYYRSKKRNKAVGGNDNSRHRLWLAVDGSLDDPTDALDFINECKRQGLRALPSNDGAIHVQTL